MLLEGIINDDVDDDKTYADCKKCPLPWMLLLLLLKMRWMVVLENFDPNIILPCIGLLNFE